MSTLLYILASPRGPRSYSTQAADAFVESYRLAHPADQIKTLNVFTENIPTFDGFALQAKYSILHGQKQNPQEVAAWKEVEAVIEEFKAADKYLFAVPMWNFGIPYRLKHYIDVLLQPGYTFTFDPKTGYSGLVTGKPVVGIYARGGAYPAGTPGEAYDLQKRYMEQVLGFIGFTDMKSFVVEPTLMEGPEAGKKHLEAILPQLREAAKTF
jgi:FMN-dependent NADH-azoreductase